MTLSPYFFGLIFYHTPLLYFSHIDYLVLLRHMGIFHPAFESLTCCSCCLEASSPKVTCDYLLHLLQSFFKYYLLNKFCPLLAYYVTAVCPTILSPIIANPLYHALLFQFFFSTYHLCTWVFLDSQYLSTGWAILLASFSQPPTQNLLTGWEFLSIFQPGEGLVKGTPSCSYRTSRLDCFKLL